MDNGWLINEATQAIYYINERQAVASSVHPV